MLDAIVPVPGVQEYLLEHWIEASDLERAKREDGADCYHDGTYDWYAGFAAYVKPKSILEIGVYRGYSAAAMCFAVPGVVERLVGIDSGLDSSGTTSWDALSRIVEDGMAASAHFAQADTQVDDPKEIMSSDHLLIDLPKVYDLVHIDADHAYEACKNDLIHFAPLCAVGGIVVIHDTEDPNVLQAVMDYYNDRRGEFDIRNIPTVNGNIVLQRKAIEA